MAQDTAKSMMKRPTWLKASAWGAGVVFLLMCIIGIYWSRTPAVFWVNEYFKDNTHVVGYATSDTLVKVADTLLEKPGGYLSNDVMPPSVFLDNMPNWEFGVLQQVRDLARVIRNDYSRSQSQSSEDPDIAAAEPLFFFNNDSWILPPTESEYRKRSTDS